MTDLYILGAGGFAREVAALVEDINGGRYYWDVRGLLPRGELPPPGAYVALGMGSPAARRRAVAEVSDLDCRFPNLIHPRATTHDSVTFGPGAVVMANCILTCDITIGAFAQFNMAVTVGHDTTLGDYVTCSPGVHLSGNVHVGDDVFLGSGAVVREHTTIHDGAVVGAGAVVLVDVPADTTVVGVPAR